MCVCVWELEKRVRWALSTVCMESSVWGWELKEDTKVQEVNPWDSVAIQSMHTVIMRLS